MSKLFPATLRETGIDAPPSYKLMVRAGVVRQVTAGVYCLMPLAFRALQKIRAIIFEEMARRDVLNMEFCLMQPRELWDATGRWQPYIKSKTMFVTKDWHTGSEFGLAPTAEDLATWLVAQHVHGLRQLPLQLHQIGRKFRDELRPRSGLLRTREFEMSDAYSFDRDEAGMKASFQMYQEIYQRIYARCGLKNFIRVQADSGAIGGKGSAEFMALSEAGEDTLLTCGQCDYGANVEKATSLLVKPRYSKELKPLRKEPTPHIRSVEELEKFFHLSPQHMVKTIIFLIDGKEPVAVCIRGDLDINEVKLRNALHASIVEAAPDAVVERVTQAPVGFAGPIGLKGVKILFDESVRGMTNFLCGCNEKDFHLLDVNFGRDLPAPPAYYDLRLAQEGETCRECQNGALKKQRGIEVGHIFMLQTIYSEKVGATFQDEQGKQQAIWMGSYGIGTTRLLQAIIEQSRDDAGIVWPKTIAPFQVHIVPINNADEHQAALARALYEKLSGQGIETMLDDRDLRAGAKFADADLLGFPYRITVGRKAEEGIIELRERATGEIKELDAKEVVNILKAR